LSKPNNQAASASPQDTAAPYPGLRPYRREERHLFFGRARDAALLCNQILAAHLTLFFGQSGRGKSSLLRTLLIPELEGEGSRIFAYDNWTPENPVAALAEALSEFIEGSEKILDESAYDDKAGGLESAPLVARVRTASRPTSDSILPALVRRLTVYDPRPLVIVLDQFEEFFVHHEKLIPAMRRELAALVRLAANDDVRIVVSLREEFLASLESFRRDIPGLFDSTYRLEPLTEDAVREAITEPARAFGALVDPALVDRLIADIEGGVKSTEQERALIGGADIELPTLQMVLKQLWEAASCDGRKQIDLGLYERLGGSRKVLADHVSKVMPRGHREQWLAARLLRHLAPSSGLKAAFSVKDLAVLENQSAQRVGPELDRLAAAGTRHRGRGR